MRAARAHAVSRDAAPPESSKRATSRIVSQPARTGQQLDGQRAQHLARTTSSSRPPHVRRARGQPASSARYGAHGSTIDTRRSREGGDTSQYADLWFGITDGPMTITKANITIVISDGAPHMVKKQRYEWTTKDKRHANRDNVTKDILY
ncbi:hypothetical protein F511_26492 [Dorcoceras hygrometricum]|uniref:Uncharacterized protein n=1 Tax=Dorcoceras hygrometricum TaxID=472368 RepID=A0A2Z7BK34_9LAMI|nr:hypothetical protein F511_26492 [Dorcoceras hygrometricum]